MQAMTSRRKWAVGCGALLVAALLSTPLLVALTWRITLGPDVGHHFDSEGVRIHYVEKGRGTPVLLVHGFASSAHLEWQMRGLVRELSREYRVIALDNRGHGRSEKPHDPEAYGVRMVEDLVRLMDHLGIDRVHVVGYSMGGFITLKLVAMHPERLLSAIPCGAGWEQLTPENLAFGEAVARALETGEGVGPLTARLGVRDKPLWLPERLAIRLGMEYFNDPLALAAVMRQFHALAVSEEELRANSVPVLTLMGGKDGLRPSAEDLSERMANHTLRILEGKDHFNTPSAREFLQEVRQFLAMHTPEHPEARR